jgi:hypothetical protein
MVSHKLETYEDFIIIFLTIDQDISGYEITVGGKGLAVLYSPKEADVYIRFSKSKTEGRIPIKYIDKYPRPFKEMYVDVENHTGVQETIVLAAIQKGDLDISFARLGDIRIYDSKIAVPVDIQFISDDTNQKIREVHGTPKYQDDGGSPATGTAGQTVTVDIINVPAGEVYVFTRIEITTDTNVTEAQVLADGNPIDEKIGASSSQVIDLNKYPKGIKVTSKLSIQITSPTSGAGSVSWKTWRYETT